MKRTEVIVIGGGQAGLAMSRSLHARGIGHVVLERGRVGERWLSERWDSARLLSPNWQSRLPGYRYEGGDPNGYMRAGDVAGYLEGYARSFDCPLLTGTSVQAVEHDGGDYVVRTDRGTWVATAVVVATGACSTPRVPAMSAGLSSDIDQLVPTRYRNPEQLAPGGVLVVGASASGIQLADEIVRSGRDVTLAVGRHRRAPRRWRGRDILKWLDEIGVWSEEVGPKGPQPSLQLVGTDEYRNLDLEMLGRRGVRLAGRAVGIENDRVRFADDLAETMAEADAKLLALLGRIEEHIEDRGLAGSLPPAERVSPLAPPAAPASLDLHAAGYGTVLWATGFRRSYPWLKVPVLDERGEIRQGRGIADVPGLYVLGLPFLRRRNSHTLDGVGRDAVELADHLAGWLGLPGRAAA
jgi:putative flavoprotein involved in K+ transport